MIRIALIAALIAPALSLAAEPAPSAKQVEFFETKIRPVLVDHCYKCHSEAAATEKKLKGGFKLDTKAGLLKGGETGPAIVAGKADAGTLLASLKHDGEVKMPPQGKLPDAVIKNFEKWIADGAADPRTGNIAKTSTIDIEKGKLFWSFQLFKEPPIPSIPNTKHQTPNTIDRFIQAKWKEKNLTPAKSADKRTLIRRAYFDLTGLPPSPDAVDAFIKADAPDAFAKVIDTLLASPHYGEKWARHWLDVARYAEDEAHTFAVTPKTQAWRYRDWVIAAFNSDMPYDRFVKLQIAGDMLPDAPSDAFTKFAGMGYLGLGPEYYRDAGCGPRADADELDDRVDTLTRGFLGLTVACARCHDHKFDPIPTKDYYSLAGIYAGTKLTHAQLGPPDEVKAFQTAQANLKKAEDKLKKAQADLKAKKEGVTADMVKELTAEVAKLKKEVPPAPPIAHVVSGNGIGMKVYIRGNHLTPGEAAPKGFLQVLPSLKQSGADYTRLDLANAIASKDNPLTARVIVNRVWAWHFGRGIVNSPSNFGALGDRPTHPELLDWLAVNFIKNGWSLKWLHKQIMTATTYQLSSNAEFGIRNAESKKWGWFSIPQSEFRNPNLEDAANVYLWRGTRKRLEVEDWRDALLAVSGNLDPQSGGPTFDLRNASVHRRTVYAKISRHDLNGLLRLFDFPDANVTADKRTATTVPQQQLFALNSEFMIGQAKAFAKRVESLGTTDAERVAAAYRLAFGRAPEQAELDLALRFLNLPPTTDDKLTRWQQYAQVLLASNEMMYVD